MPIENIEKLINEITKHGMTLSAYTYIYIALIAVIASGFGTYISAYFKKRGEEKAIHDNFNSLLSRIEKTTSLTEEIKASIGISTIEHQIRYNKYHEKRIDIIEGLYHRLTRMELFCREFLLYGSLSNEAREKFQRAKEAIDEFITYSKFNKFWVGEKLFNEIEEVALKIDKMVHNNFIYSKTDPLDTQKLMQAMKKNKKAVNEINEEIPLAKEKIIKSIRKILDPGGT